MQYFLKPSNPLLFFPSKLFPATPSLLSCPAPIPFPSPFSFSSQQCTLKISTKKIKWLTFTTCFIMLSLSPGLHGLNIPAWLFLCYSHFLSFFLVTLLRVGFFLSIAYLTVANLAPLGILVHCQVSVRSQYLVRLLSQCWITGGHTIHPPIEGLLPPTGIEPTLFRSSALKVAGLQSSFCACKNRCLSCFLFTYFCLVVGFAFICVLCTQELFVKKKKNWFETVLIVLISYTTETSQLKDLLVIFADYEQ